MSNHIIPIAISILILINCVESEKPPNCVPVNGLADKIVCVCKQNECDWLKYEFPQKSGSAHFISTTKQGNRFQVSDLEFTKTNSPPLEDSSAVQIDLSKRHQSILGWGGAFTDAAGLTITSLSENTQRLLMESYFDRDGLQYNIGRVPIGGCDFSPRNYTYDDLPDGEVDYDLKKWSLADEDHKYKLPLIKRAYQLRQGHSKDKIKFFGSPWSPPAWMKDNHNITRGHLIDDPRMYQEYANYLVKFYTTYEEKLKFKFWGGTVQNEPASAYQPSYGFNSMELGSFQTAKFVGQYLGPTLELNGFTKDRFKLMVGDDNLGLINYLVPPIMRDETAAKYFSGLAFHWYSSGWQEPYDKLNECLDEIEGKVDFVLMTEACSGWKKWLEPVVILGSWERGERYAVDIFQDVLRKSAGWVDWNLALDMNGGPNWVNNTVDSPIIVNKAKDEFYKQPMYYVLGHFSRFFTPGSIRVETKPFTGGFNDSLMTVAVHNEQSNVVVINMLNRLDAERVLSLHIRGSNLGYSLANVKLAPKSISTVALKL